MSPLRIGVLAILASFSQILAQSSLPPPRNLTLLSKDFKLFLTWMPGDGYLPGVSYTVQWKEPYFLQWKDISHCRDISETSCDITCVPTELSNQYRVQVRAQMTGMVPSAWVQQKDIDYAFYVKPAPPILQLEKKENSLGVNATFLYPSCSKDIFQHEVFYDLEHWTVGIGNKKKYKQLENVMELNTTNWSNGNYCLHAQSYFQRNRSNFSKPVCIQLSGKDAALQAEAKNWPFVTLPILFMLSAGPLSVFYWYRSKLKQVQMPQTLDFSRFRSLRKLLEFGEVELATVDVLICTGLPSDTGKRNRPTCDIALIRSPSLYSLSEEDDDDSGDPIPYTEMLRFQQQHRTIQRSGIHQKTPYPSSKSGKVQANGRPFPDLTVSEPFVSTGWMTESEASGFSESQCSSISQNSSIDDFSDSVTTSSSANTEEQEEASGDIDILFCWPRLAEGPGFTFPSRRQSVVERDHPEANCGQLDVSHLLEDHFMHHKDFEKDLGSCRGLVQEIPLEEVSCKEDIENEGLGSNGDTGVLSSSRFHGYQRRHIQYVPRTQIKELVST